MGVSVDSVLKRFLKGGEQEVEGEEEGGAHEDRMDFLDLACDGFDDDVGDEGEADPGGDVVEEGHEGSREEGRNGFGEVGPVDVRKSAGHQDPDDDQDRSGSGSGNQTDERGRDDGDQEEDRDGDGGEAGTSAFFDPGGGFDVGGGVGGAQEGADGRGDGVREEGFVHTAGEAFTVFQGFFVFFGEDAGTTAGPDEGADGVEGVREAEGEDGGQDDRESGRIGEEGRNPDGDGFPEDLAQGREGGADGAHVDVGSREVDDAHRDPQQGGGDHADE